VSAAEFYFAEVDPVHAGKVMRIELWDPGEGSSHLQFLDPLGNEMPFRYTARNLTDVFDPAAATWTTTAAVCPQDPSDTFCMPAAYPSRFVTIEIPLAKPDGSAYTCNGSDCWWKVRYHSTGDVDDTTTWAVEIIGDPVRLTE
jgi:hypothetical protein